MRIEGEGCGFAPRVAHWGDMLSTLGTAVSVGVGFAGAVGLAVGGNAYGTYWPTSQIFGSTLTAPRRPGELALTFDDGPNPKWTPRLLEILAEHEVHATFFVIGKFVEAERDLLRRIVTEGHTVANHSWSHPNLARTGTTKVREELRRTSDILQQILGEAVRFFRPPFGARRPAVLRAARELELMPVTWNAMTNDWNETSAGKIAATLGEKIDRNHKRGFASNIVLHDGGHLLLGANRGPSVDAAQRLLTRYGTSHTFVTLGAWLDAQVRA